MGYYSAKVWVVLHGMSDFPSPGLLHEMGHNLGLHHADLYGDNQDDQGDTSSLMCVKD